MEKLFCMNVLIFLVNFNELFSLFDFRKVLWFASVVAVALIVIMLGYRANYLGDKERQQQRQRYYESAANLPRDSSSSLHENHDLESSILMADHFIDYLKRYIKLDILASFYGGK